MISKTDLIILFMSGASAAILFFCAIVLGRGGFPSLTHEPQKPNRIQKNLCACVSLLFLQFIAMSVNEYLLDAPNPLLTVLIDSSCIVSLAFVPLGAFILQQKKLTFKHWLVSFGATFPLLVIAIVTADPTNNIYLYASLVTYLFMLAMIVYSLIQLTRWDRQMLDIYSDVTHKRTVWFRHLTIPLLLVTLMWFPLYFFPEFEWLNVIYYIIVMIASINLTAYALVQEEFILEADVAFDETNTTTDHTAPTTDEPIWAARLEALMREQHVYRQDNLTSGELATMLHINRTYLSRYLNEVKNTNFYDYINSYRLEECRQLMAEDLMNLNDIATFCGFKDRTALYRVFRKHYGQSPTEWMQANKP